MIVLSNSDDANDYVAADGGTDVIPAVHEDADDIVMSSFMLIQDVISAFSKLLMIFILTLLDLP